MAGATTPPVPQVVDTSAWVEWLTDSALGREIGQEFPDKAQCLVPTIVQLELAKWLTRELGEERSDQVIAYTQKCQVVPMDTTIAPARCRHAPSPRAGHGGRDRLRHRAAPGRRPADLRRPL